MSAVSGCGVEGPQSPELTLRTAVASGSAGAGICTRLTSMAIGSKSPKWPVVSATGTCQDEVYALTARGHDYYWGWDRGGFAFVPVQSGKDFVFTARILQARDLGLNSVKIGIAVREHTIGNERAIQLRWDGFFGGNPSNAQVSWFYRHSLGATDGEFCPDNSRDKCFREGGTGVKSAEGTWLRIAREGASYRLETSADGKTWHRTAADQQLSLVYPTAYVGLIAAFGGGETPYERTVKFDKITCEGPGCPATSASNYRVPESLRRVGAEAGFMPDFVGAKGWRYPSVAPKEGAERFWLDLQGRRTETR